MGDENGAGNRPESALAVEELPLKRALEQDAAPADGQEAAKAGAEPVAQNDAEGSAPAAGGGAAGGAAPPAATFQIVVAFKKDKYTLDVSETDLVKDLKEKLEPLSGVPSGNQKLMFKGMLQDAATLGSSGLKAGTKNMKLMLIGTSQQDIAKEHLNKIVAAVEAPLATSQVAAASKLTEVTEHKKVLDKGVPEGATPGIVGRKAQLFDVQNVIRNVYDKRGELVRLTFKLEENQLWIGGKSRTDKLSLAQIRGVTWETIKDHAGYNILVLQAGATDKSNLYFYFVPAQFCDDIKNLILS